VEGLIRVRDSSALLLRKQRSRCPNGQFPGQATCAEDAEALGRGVLCSVSTATEVIVVTYSYVPSTTSVVSSLYRIITSIKSHPHTCRDETFPFRVEDLGSEALRRNALSVANPSMTPSKYIIYTHPSRLLPYTTHSENIAHHVSSSKPLSTIHYLLSD